MTTTGENGKPPTIDSSNHTPKRDDLPLELMDVIKPALQFGGLSALSGTVVGGFSGIIVSRTPILFTVAATIQWGILGTTFWGTRTALLSRYQAPTPKEKSISTTLAASLAGATGGLLRSRKNILPGFFVFGAMGYVGQRIYDAVDERKTEEVRIKEMGEAPDKKSWMESKWVPWKALSDAEYEDMLREKMLKVDAEIALVDESLDRLREQQKQEAKEGVAEAKKT